MPIVQLPDGRRYNFPTEQAASEFRKRVGIQQPTLAENLQQRSDGGLLGKLKGFGKELGKAAISPFAKFAVSAEKAGKGVYGLGKAAFQAATGDTEAARRTIFETGAEVEKTRKLGGLGEFQAAQTPLQGIGVGLELGSYLPGTGAATGVVKGALAHSLKQMAIQGAKYGSQAGLLAGLGLELQQEAPTLSSVLVGGATGAAGGAVIGAALPGALAAPKLVVGATREALGVTTGLGSKNLSRLYNVFAHGTDKDVAKATRALRTDPADIFEGLVGQMKNGIQKIRHQRNVAYRKDLAKLKESDSVLSLDGLKNKLTEIFNEFNIKKDARGNIDFSRATLSNVEENKVVDIANEVLSWGRKEGDNTVLGLDILKQRLDDFWSPTSNKTNVFVSKLRDVVKQQLDSATNGKYGKMTKAYQESLQLEQQIKKALSLTDKASLDTAFKKVNSVMRSNNEYRLSLLRELEKELGQDIGGIVAASQAQQFLPRGIIRPVLGGGAVLGAGGGAIPSIITAMTVASPRVVGEMIRGLGLSKRMIRVLLNKLRTSNASQAVIKELEKIAGSQGGYARIPGLKGNGAATPKTASSLLQEARKYKSAEEFVKAQPTYYHGTNAKFDTFEGGHKGIKVDTNGGFYFSPYKETAKNFGENIKEVVLDIKNPKIAKTYREIGLLKKSDIQQAIKEGYDGYYFKPSKEDLASGYMKPYNEEWVAFYPEQIKTKSQLKDIWNKANRK